MRYAHLAAGLMATIFSLGSFDESQAQTVPESVDNAQSTITTSTSIYRMPTMSAPVAAEPNQGQIQSTSYDNKILGINFGKNVSKTITIEPGMSQVSLEGFGWRDKAILTLVNPSATPLQFETTERWGKEMTTVVPPHSQKTISFSQPRPFNNNDIKFVVMQQPENAIASNQDYVTQQTAAVATVQQTATNQVLEQQTAMMRQGMDQQTATLQNSQQEAIRSALGQQQQMMERRSAVRGYW